MTDIDAATGIPTKPSKLKVLAILIIVSGGLNILWGLFQALSLLGLNIFACFWSPASLCLGGFELYVGIKLLGNPIGFNKPPIALSICEICGILLFNFLGLWIYPVVVGILGLVFFADDEVKAYFDVKRSQAGVDV
jgi:hypothetical protein